MQSGLLSWYGEYIEHAREAEYRTEHLPEFLRQIRLCLWCSVIVNIGFLFSDWRFYGQPHFYFAITARSVIEIMSLAGLASMAKADSFRHFQFLCIAWACPVIPACAVLMSSHSDIALLATFVLPVLFYLAIPVSFRWTLFFGLSSSVATLAAYLPTHSISRANLGLILGMLLNNVIQILVLSQSKRLRRLEWAATQAGRVANEELSEHRNMLQKILKAIPAPLVILSKDGGKLIQANDAACSYFGADLLHNPLKIEDYIDHHDWAKLVLELRAEGQVAGFETQLHLPNRSARDVLLEATTVTISGAEAILTVLVDITHRKEVETVMKRLANTDPLSGLPNRAHFFAVAVDEIKRAKQFDLPLAVFMADIDFFKHINDTYGHNTGDSALKAFARLCRTWIRRQDIVARLGGEEFGFLLPETDIASALALADRLRMAVEDLQIDRLPKPMTISIGVSEVCPGETTIDAALSRADQALYAAKRTGRNQVVRYDFVEFAPESVSQS
jgi:diguanylate cyclase (GGDEF)-like protein